jgi:hypothetical protein
MVLPPDQPLDPTPESVAAFSSENPSVAGTSPGPEALSIAPPSEEPHQPAAEQEGAPPPPEEQAQPAVLDPRYREDVEGLAFVGYLQDEIHWLGHTFVIRTLDVDQILEVGLLTKAWSGLPSFQRAYQVASVAASLYRVDGQPLAVPLEGSAPDLADKFRVVKRWFPPTVDHVYDRLLRLEVRATEAIEAALSGNPGG